MTKQTKRIQSLFCIAVLVSSLTACNRAATPSETQPANVGIQTMVVHSTQTTDFLEVPAHITADPANVVHIYRA